MKKVFWMVWMPLLLAGVATGQFEDPFGVEARLEKGTIRVDVSVPPKHYLYADHFEVTDALGHPQKALELPSATTFTDPVTGKTKRVFDHSFTATYAWKPSRGGEGAFHVRYSGCNDHVCFVPQEKTVELAPASGQAAEKPSAPPGGAVVSDDWKAELAHFRVLDSQAGYLKSGEFLDFMDRAENGGAGEKASGIRLFLSDPVAFVREAGMLPAIFLILVGGLLLNLTPCVLPMIPINLAIIGAGAQAGSRGRGFALGAAYGLGIALSYGLLGALIVATGSRFGTIQANPWFNLAIALIFVVLALGMFDVVQIDLSRFQSGMGGGPRKQGSFAVAISMGAVAALLAGACVAPVVIAVLLLAAGLGPAGLALPFVLGLGMALPWPFAGAGLSFLPKPGKWMKHVKYAFGAGILLFALYYAHLGYRGFRPEKVAAGQEAGGHVVVDGATNRGLAAALRQAREEGKPVFIDFWASWCKNCAAMERGTFRDAAVKARLEDYLFVKYLAEDPSSPETRAVMDRFKVQGLPTFVVLEPVD